MSGAWYSFSPQPSDTLGPSNQHKVYSVNTDDSKRKKVQTSLCTSWGGQPACGGPGRVPCLPGSELNRSSRGKAYHSSPSWSSPPSSASLHKWFQKFLFTHEDPGIKPEDGAGLLLRTHLEREMKDGVQGPQLKAAATQVSARRKEVSHSGSYAEPATSPGWGMGAAKKRYAFPIPR